LSVESNIFPATTYSNPAHPNPARPSPTIAPAIVATTPLRRRK